MGNLWRIIIEVGLSLLLKVTRVKPKQKHISPNVKGVVLTYKFDKPLLRVYLRSFIKGSIFMQRLSNGVAFIGYEPLDKSKSNSAYTLDAGNIFGTISNVELSEPPYDKTHDYNYIHPDTVMSVHVRLANTMAIDLHRKCDIALRAVFVMNDVSGTVTDGEIIAFYAGVA